MIGSRSRQPSRRSGNFGDYDRLFIPRVHTLLKLGYDRLTPKQYAREEETAITGDLVESIEAVLDYPTGDWMRFYSVYDDPPVNEPRRRGRRRRRGRERRRVDIRLASSKTSPRTRFRFECKRLDATRGVDRYLGGEGLGCFLAGKYAQQDSRAGMVGYVQSDSEDTWARRIATALGASADEYAVRHDSPWRHEPVIKELEHTYRSGHGRGRGRGAIEVYHTLLRFY